MRLAISLLLIVASTLPNVATAQDPLALSEDETSSSPAGRIIRYAEIIGESEPTVIDALDFVRSVTATSRESQDAIYEFSRTINNNINAIKCPSLTNDSGIDPVECSNFLIKIRAKNEELLEASYTDDLLQNANLSRQINTRLQNLVADSLRLIKDTKDTKDTIELSLFSQHVKEFDREYQLISDRYLRSKRFRLGVGLSNTYLPRIKYTGSDKFDFSVYQNSISGGSDSLFYISEFSNEASTSFLLSAKIPLIQLDITFPNVSKNQTATQPVRSRDIDDSDVDLLYRTTISSTLEIDYDVGINLSVSELLPKDWIPEPLAQSNFGFGLGVTGVKVTDELTSNVRLTTASSTIFSELENSDVISTRQEKSYTLPFFDLYYAIEISDELQVSVDARYYLKSNANDSVDVEDISVSMKAIWFPTFFQ